MLHDLRECQDTGAMLRDAERRGPTALFEAHELIHKCLENGSIDTNKVSIRDLFIGLVEGGQEYVEYQRFHKRRHMHYVPVQEASDAVMTGHFTDIIGQITYDRVRERMEGPNLIGQDLFTTVSSNTQFQEQLPSVAPPGDAAERVGEGMEYPIAGLSADYITIPEKVKHGFIVPVTEEAVFEDKTNMVLRQLDSMSKWMAINQEKELLDTAFGTSTGIYYSRNGGAPQAVYGNTHTDGDFDNLAGSNALVNYEDVDAALQLFDAITDPETGEPVFITGSIQIVVPRALYMTALRVLNATEVQEGQRAAGAILSSSPNPLRNQTMFQFTLLSSTYVKSRTASDSTWFVGDFRSAFEYHENIPLQVSRLEGNHHLNFNRDILTAVKVRRKGTPAVVEPRYVVKCTS